MHDAWKGVKERERARNKYAQHQCQGVMLCQYRHGKAPVLASAGSTVATASAIGVRCVLLC
jgi:hypothetical protein